MVTWTSRVVDCAGKTMETISSDMSSHSSVIKLETLPWPRVDRASSVTTSLLLVLLFGEALASRDDEVLVGSISVIVAYVVVRKMLAGLSHLAEKGKWGWLRALVRFLLFYDGLRCGDDGLDRD